VRVPAYSIPALATEWSVAPAAIDAEIAAGRLVAFEINGELRVADEDARAFKQRAQLKARPNVRVQGIQKLKGSFTFRWPETAEHFAEHWRADLVTSEGKRELRVGRCRRKAMGRARDYTIAFIDGKPMLELAGVDDQTQRVGVAIVKDPAGRHVRSTDAAPDAYREFDLVEYADHVKGPWARHGIAVRVDLSDIETIGRVAHARMQVQRLRPKRQKKTAA